MNAAVVCVAFSEEQDRLLEKIVYVPLRSVSTFAFKRSPHQFYFAKSLLSCAVGRRQKMIQENS